MIYLITGNPGAKKTAFCVATLLKIENENKVNIPKNAKIYAHNLDVLNQKDMLNELTYLTKEVGTGNTLRNEIEVLDKDYYSFLANDDFDHLRPDYYFKRSTDFNNTIERIQELHGDLGLQYFYPVRTIYTNIRALKIDYVRDLEEDWRKCPDGSVVVIDEIQLVYPYRDTKDKSHPVVQELSVHRHRGFDFYFITQSAGNLHVLIKDLVHAHYHVTNPFGWQSKIYQYGNFESNPNAMTVRLRAENSFTFNPPVSIFKLYKSTTINTAKARLPIKRLLIIGSFFFGGLCLALYALFSVGGTNPADELEKQKPTENQELIANPIAPDSTLETDNNPNQPRENERIIIKPQTIEEKTAKYLNDFHVEFNHDNIRPAQVVTNGKKCMAFNKYGDKLNVTQVQCLDLSMGAMPKAKQFTNNTTATAQPTQAEPTADEQQTPQQQQTTQGITSTEEYLFADKSKTEPIFNPS
ncbi:Zonula occludens toxin [Moraxella caprae]|uniref:Zonula occludens toxin n=1 Tax=Moraxella caprae TaxID=90240 RepID=A0A378QZ63_9GAMM|nr:zonular occludens toxin domain-containing protein [Moraxella caprae]STZ08292.1 Zonula occludens toxin [Moraxella caprae]